jgi:uncharacterized protein YjgD (DUF1641 family)
MPDQNIQSQIDELNQKMDIILEEVYAQKEARESLVDLKDDISVIGKDIFRTTVNQLDKAGIEPDMDALASLGLQMIRNIRNFSELMENLESINDFLHDATPILRQMGLDAVHKMNELEQKGYIDFFREVTRIVDNIVTHYKPDDVRALANNIVTILETIRNMTQPDMMNAVNNAVSIYKKLGPEDITEYSLIRALMEFRKPEMKRGVGYMIAFLKRLNETAKIK